MASPDSEEPELTESKQGIEATVQQSYRAEKDDELDLEEGDVVQVFESRKDGWLRGAKQERSGWFPGSHIKGCTKGVVGWSYHAENDFILDLEEGDVVLIFDKRKDGWWRGMIGEREGLFQAGYLQGYTQEIVQYSYRAEKDDEIDLVIGDIVLVLEKSEDGRCKAVIGEREGWFPGNCTSELPDFTQALVKIPYHSDDDGELDLEKDDVVTVLLKRDSHWWIGEFKEERGLFPANNMKEIKVIEGTVQNFYRAEKDDELDLEEGDVVQVFESRKDGWLRGVKQDRSGWFPGSHIKGCTKEIVKFSRHAEEDDELDLEESDIVLVLDKPETGWWRGIIGEKEGYFPADMLQGYSAEIVQYSYRAEKDDEIDLAIGEIVLVLEKSEDGRCKAVIGEREGWFPGNCTSEKPKSSQALVETSHHGDDDEDELDLEEGDVVTVLLKRDSHWWIGQLEEERGLFPANNVKEIKVIEATVQQSYCAEKDDELDLEEGDVIKVFESCKDGWLRGVKQKRSGWFPGSHIKGCTKEIVKVSRHAEEDDELDLEEGDIVLVLDKPETGWWRGIIGEKEGYFPADMLQGYSAEIVQYSYRAEKDDEIDLAIGEIVLVLEKSEDGRCKAVIGEREGWFPGNCTSERPKSSQALVETSHHGDDDEDELDLEEGDVVTVLLKRDSHWWIGQLEEERGLFPANHVKEIKVIEATVQHSYHARKDDELDLEEGDVVKVFESRKDGWLRGVKQKRIGWFPGSHIKGCTKEIVKFSRHAEEDYQLDLEEGDIVLVFEKLENGWWRGMVGEREGLFPADILQGYIPEIVPYPYRAEKDDEIDLAIGEIVLVLEKSEDGRCRGVIGEREGWFPGNCTRELPINSQALVETPYHSDNDGELHLKKDDVVTVLLKRDSFWWIGQLQEKKGLFPANNVKEIKGINATVQNFYRAEKDDELDLEEGDVVQVFESRKDGWLRGVKQERSGWFPGSHIKGYTQARVQYSYDAEEDDELDLKKGDVIQVLAKGEDGRWSGVNGGRTGWFPGTCVKEMEQPSFTSESKELNKALEFQKNLEDVLKTSASVTLKITKCTTIGPPEVGKTHLKCLLLGQEWDPNTGRTDVIRAPEWVEHYIEDSSTWKLFERDERMQAIFRNIMNKKYQEVKEEAQKGEEEGQRGKEKVQRGKEEGQRGKEEVQRGKEEDQKGKERVQRGKEDDQKRKMHESHPKTGATFQQHKEPNKENARKAKNVHVELSKSLNTLDANLGDVMKGNHLSDSELEGHILGEKRLLYFVDTGGQEYYHDIHPILITSPSVYFVVFNLMKCLEEGGGAKFFREELIQRPLRSIHAFGTKRVRESKFLKIHPSDPKIFIIGTHLDQVREAGVKEEIESISSDVQSELLTKPYNRFLQPDPSDLAFWPIDNTLAGKPLDEDSEDSEYICDLKSEAVEGVYDAEVTVPLSWLILEQTIKTVPEADLFPYRQLFNLCLKRKLIRSEEEFQTMLYIFHILGLFFFPPILKDAPLRDDEVVYTNPDFLYRMTSKLLKECRFRESAIAKETCPQQGVIQNYQKLLSVIGVKENNRESFLNMLQELKIIVKIKSEDLILFPAALPATNQVPSSEAASSPGPLLLSFTSSRLLKVCYIPTGFFRLLIADLAAKPTWTLDLDKLSHNSVTFDVGTGVLGLLERVSFIEMTFMPSDDSLPSSSSHNAMYQQLKERVLSLWSNVYGQKDESSEQWVHWGFPCESHPEEHHTHIAKFIGDQGEYVATCLHPTGKFIQRVRKEQLKWFLN